VYGGASTASAARTSSSFVKVLPSPIKPASVWTAIKVCTQSSGRNSLLQPPSGVAPRSPALMILVIFILPGSSLHPQSPPTKRNASVGAFQVGQRPTWWRSLPPWQKSADGESDGSVLTLTTTVLGLGPWAIWTSENARLPLHVGGGSGRLFGMSPQAALDYQIERYRKMTGEQRLALALELHELACDVAREGIRAQHPQAEEAEVERFLRRRLELVRSV
jgi:hypothetical protein